MTTDEELKRAAIRFFLAHEGYRKDRNADGTSKDSRETEWKGALALLKSAAIEYADKNIRPSLREKFVQVRP